MAILTVALAKLHSKEELTDQDSVLEIYLGAAEDIAAEYLNRKIYADDTAKGSDATGIVINNAIKEGILLIFGHAFANREDVVTGVSVSKLPNGASFFLDPYRLEMGV